MTTTIEMEGWKGLNEFGRYGFWMVCSGYLHTLPRRRRLEEGSSRRMVAQTATPEYLGRSVAYLRG